MRSRATKPPDVPLSGRERLSRLMLACLGLMLAISPPVLVAGFGWPDVSLVPAMPLGVLLVVLSAFYPRINGEVRCGPLSVTISPTDRPSADGRR